MSKSASKFIYLKKNTYSNGWVSMDKSNKHTLIYIYVYIFRWLLTVDKCVILFLTFA